MAKQPAPKTSAPIEEHKRHATEFLLKQENKQPKSGKVEKTDVANP